MYEIASIENDGKSIRHFDDSYGGKFVFKVACTDGTVCEVNKQKDEPPQVGDRYKVLKQASSPDFLPTLKDKEYADPSQGSFQTKSGGGKYEADPRGLRGKNASSALHAAISLVDTADMNVSSDSVVALAGKLYDFIESKAKVGA